MSIVNLLAVLFLVFKDFRDGKLQEGHTFKTDTVLIKHDSIIYSQPRIIKTIAVENNRIEYLPDTGYERLVEQYRDIVDKYISKTVQIDSLKIDSIGYIAIEDTVSENKITSRSFKYDLNYPKITQTLIVPQPPVPEFYLGGALGTSGVEASLLYKTRRSRMYGIGTGVTPQGNFLINGRMYFKISK